MSHWWHQKWHSTKTAAVLKESLALHVWASNGQCITLKGAVFIVTTTNESFPNLNIPDRIISHILITITVTREALDRGA